jgi:hypothetical protein
LSARDARGSRDQEDREKTAERPSSSHGLTLRRWSRLHFIPKRVELRQGRFPDA